MLNKELQQEYTRFIDQYGLTPFDAVLLIPPSEDITVLGIAVSTCTMSTLCDVPGVVFMSAPDPTLPESDALLIPDFPSLRVYVTDNLKDGVLTDGLVVLPAPPVNTMLINGSMDKEVIALLERFSHNLLLNPSEWVGVYEAIKLVPYMQMQYPNDPPPPWYVASAILGRTVFPNDTDKVIRLYTHMLPDPNAVKVVLIDGEPAIDFSKVEFSPTSDIIMISDLPLSVVSSIPWRIDYMLQDTYIPTVHVSAVFRTLPDTPKGIVVH